MLDHIRRLFCHSPPLTRDEEAEKLVAFILMTRPETLSQLPIKQLREMAVAVAEVECRPFGDP